MPWSTRWTLARGASAGNSWTIVVLIISDRAPATSTPVGPPPTTTKSRAPSSARCGSRVGLLEGLDDPRLQAIRVVEGIERERVLRPGRPEEVRLGAGRQDEVVAGVRLAAARRHGPGHRIDGHDLGALRIELVEFGRDLAQRVGDVAGRQHRRRDLVEERLELVVVVLVDERDVQVLALGELPGTGDAGEPATDDHDALRAARRRVPGRRRPVTPAQASEGPTRVVRRRAVAQTRGGPSGARRGGSVGGAAISLMARSRSSPKAASSRHGRLSSRPGFRASSATARMTSSSRSRA